MKTYLLSLIAMLMLLGNLSAQYTPTLEFAAGEGPTGSGPSIAAQKVTFMNNTNNPTGSTFAAFTTPTTTVTFSLSNQQYPLATKYSSTGASVVFGGGNNLNQKAINGYTYYNTMGAYSAPSPGDFTSAGTVAAGTGIDPSQDYSLQVFTSVTGLIGSSTSGNYYMADLTITFSNPVSNPVLHFVGMGATYGSLGFSGELEQETPTLPLTLLSGSAEMSVSGNQILNSASHFGGTTGSGAASGSVLVSGTNITALTFRVLMQGDGQGAAWGTTSTASGDGWMIGVSVLTSAVVVLPLTITDFSATAAGSGAQLQWEATADINSAYFEVESSRDAVTFQSIGTVMATDDNSGANTTYRYTDSHAAPGNDFYRIKQVDAHGNAVYSPVRAVYIDEQAMTRLTPNPVRNSLYITGDIGTIQSVVVTSVDGKQMIRYNTPGSATNGIDMSALPGGIYFVTVRHTSGLQETSAIVKY